MSEEVNDEGHLRKYLLGELTEAEQQTLEERLITEDELFDLLPVIEDELVDDYLGELLSSYERGKLESFFLSTPERRRKLSFAMALRRYVTKEAAAEAPAAESQTAKPSRGNSAGPSSVIGHAPWWNRAFSSPYVRMAAAAVILIGLGLGGWRAFFYESEVAKGMAALAKAYSLERPIEVRVTGLSYAPLANTRGSEKPKVDAIALSRAEMILVSEVDEHPSPAAHHALGRLYLSERKLNESITQFEAAMKAEPKNARLHNDLGATYLEKAIADQDKQSLSDLAKSLEQLDQAIELDASLLEAQFNKALCLQRMSARTAAREAWESYLRNDPNSEWSREAEANLRVLQEKGIGTKDSDEVLADFLASYRERDEDRAWLIQSQTKEMITRTMVPFELARRFLKANLANQLGASNEILGALRFAGNLEMNKTGDPFFAELGGFYSVAGPKNADRLKQAQEDLELGYQLCLQARYSEASQPFERARGLFLFVGDTWESRVADYWLAYCLSQRGELKRSSELLFALAEDCTKGRYRWLEAQAYAWLANNNALLGEYSQGAEQDKRAMDIALASGDSYNTQKTSSQLAEDYKFFGRLGEALELNQQSLPLAHAYYVSSRQLWRSLNSVTDTLFALRRYAAAEVYEREALELATTQFDDPVLAHNTYVRLGQIYAGQQNYAAAMESLQLSLGTIRAIEDDQSSRKLSGQSAFQIGAVNRQAGDCNTALRYYQEAAQKFDSTEFGLYNYIAHKGMLLCYLLNNDKAAVETELPVVLALFEQSRRAIKEEQNRNHFFDAEQSVYDLAIDYEWGRNDGAQAFYYAELSRARSLLDALVGSDIGSDESAKTDVSAVSQPLTLAELRQHLPANSQVVEYAVLEKRMLIWIITKTRVQVVDVAAPAATLEAATGEYLQLMAGRDAYSVERENQLASQLHDWLYAPLERFLNKAEDVAIIPDKFLFKVPFAALLSRDGRRVVDDYAVLYAPSATVLTLCTDLARTKEQNKEDERVLSVGAPILDRRAHGDLRDIPSAAMEARQIGSLYRTKAVFTEGDASKEQIEPELPQADVIHFATHYIADDVSGANSRLLLTANKSKPESDQETFDLSVHEIQAMRLPRAKLAVLSACQSGIERYYEGEGLIGLSRAFMAAGVPLVVASQWAVESDSTARLMIDFHRLRKTRNLPTVEALRQAQLDMLNHEDERYRRPYYWAGFFAIGGHTSF